MINLNFSYSKLFLNFLNRHWDFLSTSARSDARESTYERSQEWEKHLTAGEIDYVKKPTVFLFVCPAEPSTYL